MILEEYDELWLVDFEFGVDENLLPDIRCMVAIEYHSKRVLKLWRDELKYGEPPFDSNNSAMVAFYAIAELTCFKVLGWPMPSAVIDLFPEFRVQTNINSGDQKSSLLAAMFHFNLNAIESAEKSAMRDLALRGGEYLDKEKEGLLNYCETDVRALQLLLPLIVRDSNLDQTLIRGRYMQAVAEIEHTGIPIDKNYFDALVKHWEAIKLQLVADVDRDFGCFDGLTFTYKKFENFLKKNYLSWPYLPSGKLDMKSDTFSEMSLIYPQIKPLADLRATLSELKLNQLQVGADARNRCMLSPFRSKTGRNQPSTSKFAFGPATWTRGLICPPPDHSIAYIDWSQQEFGIAAALSRDPNMIEAYQSGDPYLAFAIMAGAIPPDGTKASHPLERALYKECVLAVQYGMGPESLARRINKPPAYAQILLAKHKSTFAKFWSWSDAVVSYASAYSFLEARLGWRMKISDPSQERSIRNFPMQANGSEMLRIALILCSEAEIKVCAPVHDAILIEAPTEKIESAVKSAQEAMKEASRIILDGFELRSDASVVTYPDRYMDERGIQMWNRVDSILKGLRQTEDDPSRGGV